MVLWVPIRALGLLIFRNSFKVGLVEVDAHPDEERIAERHPARGEKNAIALAKRLAAQGEEQANTGRRSVLSSAWELAQRGMRVNFTAIVV